MNNAINRSLKELFAAIYHDHEKHPGVEIRRDQERVLNELLDQPLDFKNEVLVTKDGLELHTLREKLQYIHAKAVDSRVIIRE